MTIKNFFFLIFVFFCLSFFQIKIEASTSTKNNKKMKHVLYINSYHPGYKWSDEIEKAFLNTFNSSGMNIEISSEYLDTKRFSKQKLENLKANLIYKKYKKFHHDLVIVSDNAAFDFSIKYRKKLFPDTPIVFCGYNNFHPEAIKGIKNITGVNEEMDIKGLIDTALFINPKINSLVFIISTEDITDKIVTEIIENSIVTKYQDKYKIIILKDTPLSEIKKTLNKLSQEAAVFLLGQSSEKGDGRRLTPRENNYLVSKISPMPVYTLWEFNLGTGVLGGRLLTGYDQGKAAANMAIQILKGKNADSIPVLMKSPTRLIFDYTVMQKFNINKNSLPDNSKIVNKPHLFYEDHKKVVWIAISIFTFLITLLVILVINILYRYRAEKELQKYRNNLEKIVEERTRQLTISNELLKESEERFRSLSDASFEGILFSENGKIIDINNSLANLIGSDISEIIGKNVIDLVDVKQKEEVKNKMLTEYDQPYELNFIKKDGSLLLAEVHSKIFSYKDKLIKVTAIRDLTEKRKAEEEIETLRSILPICSYCKKIRNDEGYFEQLESYLSKHTNIDFSHSICTSCLKEHFPGEYKEIIGVKKPEKK